MRLVLVLLGLLISGCVSLPSREPLRVIATTPLTSTPAAPDTLASIDHQVTVALPSAAAMLDGQRLVARHGSGELAYLAGVSLPDSGPALIQDALVAALQQAGFRAVERQGRGLHGDLSVNLQLQRFEVDYSDSQQPRGRVALQVLLIDTRSGLALGSRGFSTDEPAEATDAAAGARALLVAVAKVLAQASEWLLASASTLSEAAPPSTPPAD